ncbi:MAG: ATPase [Actinomycetia bacterium]|nr:ATPase [Actinomycetes bacterium]
MMPRGTRLGTARVTLPSDREILIRRTFDVPRTLVFEAWTTPSLVRRWWGDPTAPLVVCDIDLRVGGAWCYSTAVAGGVGLTWHGTYLEVDPPHRLRCTEIFGDDADDVAETTLTLVEHDGTTECAIGVRHTSQANRDQHLASGMEQGLQRSLDRIDALLAQHPDPTDTTLQEVIDE